MYRVRTSSERQTAHAAHAACACVRASVQRHRACSSYRTAAVPSYSAWLQCLAIIYRTVPLRDAGRPELSLERVKEWVVVGLDQRPVDLHHTRAGGRCGRCGAVRCGAVGCGAVSYRATQICSQLQ